MSLLANPLPPMDIRQLRKQLRTRRRQLSHETQEAHSHLMARQALGYKPLQYSERIAFYFAADGEMDPAPLVRRAMASGKRCYFPVLRERPAHALWFAEHKADRGLKPNRFGIPEPAACHRHITRPWGLDLIIVPLVAFDTAGNRLGMGGGFYDRTLSFMHQRRHWLGPKLIGLAHELQRIETLPIQAWDIPLDGVITEKSLYRFTNREP